MRGKGIILGIGSVAIIGILTTLLFSTIFGIQLSSAVLTPGAVGLHVEEARWDTTSARYETSLSYLQVSTSIRQQMAARGWRLLGTSPTLGPSILTFDPPGFLFERPSGFGMLYETARISYNSGSPARIQVLILRTIRWPPWRRWLRL